MITVYDDILLPNSIMAAGIRGKQLRSNTRSTALNGTMHINVNWSKTLRQYELGVAPLTVEQWQTIEGLHEATDGGAFGFLMVDPKDASATGTQGLLQPVSANGSSIASAGVGYGLPAYALYKRYTSTGSTRYKDRKITRPSTIALKRGGVAVVIGTAAGNAAINAVTGAITFVADTSQALTSITSGATTVLNFANGTGMVAALSIGDRVYLSGITGPAASLLNNLSHATTAKGATSLTLGVATTGLAAAGGTAFKYPQASESLTWTGSFHVPVHFASDEIDWELVRSGPSENRLIAGPSVTVVEVRE